MGAVWATERRVYVEDPRGGDIHLRITWHPDGRQFVLSHWQGSVCLAATRVPVESAPELIGVLSRGLGDAVAPPSEELQERPARRRSWPHRLAEALRRRTRDVRPGTPRRPPAPPTRLPSAWRRGA